MLHTQATLNQSRVGLKLAIITGANENPRHYAQVANSMTTTQQFERMRQSTGFGMPTQIGEGGDIPSDSRFNLYQKDYTPVKFATGVAVTKEAMYTNQYKGDAASINGDGARIGRMMEFAIDNSFWNLLNSGFTSTDTMDGVSLFNVAHPTNAIGPTWSNRPAINLALNSINLRAAIEQVAALRDPRNIPMIMNLDFHLVVPTGLMFEAQELQLSKMDPFTADNREVTYRNMISPLTVQWLTNQTAWFLIPRRREDHGLGILYRMPLTVENEYIPKNQTYQHYVTREWVPVITSSYGTWGTQGV